MQTHDLAQLRGSKVLDPTGDTIGKIEEIYLDDQTNKPEWLLVNTGMFGTKSNFVPLHGANRQEDAVQVPFEKSRVKDAPSIDVDRQLSQEEEAQLYRYYGLEYNEARSESGLPEGTRGDDTSGRTDEAMTRSEEKLHVGKASEETGRARLRKYVVTENVEKTVPVQREEVRVEREPITDGNVDDAMDGPAISEDEHEVVLREERPVVEKEAVPVERVRLDKDTKTEQAKVSEEVRKEEIDVDGDTKR